MVLTTIQVVCDSQGLALEDPSPTHFLATLLFPQDSQGMGYMSHSAKCICREGEGGGGDLLKPMKQIHLVMKVTLTTL